MKQTLIVTDLTRMLEPRVCLAGYLPDMTCVRPPFRRGGDGAMVAVRPRSRRSALCRNRARFPRSPATAAAHGRLARRVAVSARIRRVERSGSPCCTTSRTHRSKRFLGRRSNVVLARRSPSAATRAPSGRSRSRRLDRFATGNAMSASGTIAWRFGIRLELRKSLP